MATEKSKKTKSTKSTKVSKAPPIEDIPTLATVEPKISATKTTRTVSKVKTTSQVLSDSLPSSPSKGEGTLATPTIEAIRARAYEIWQSENCPHGKDLEHWDRAKRETLANLQNRD